MLIYTGRLVSTSDGHSSDILKDLKTWVSGAPTVIVKGEELKIVSNKSQPTKQPPKEPTKEPPKEPPRIVPIVTDEPQEGSESISPGLLVGPVIGGMALLAIVALVGVIIGAIVCHNHK